MAFQVIHNEAASRFEIALDTGDLAVLDYRLSDNSILFVHTGVPAEARGKGVAVALVREGLKYARSAGLKVVARCSYVAAYLRRYPGEAGAGGPVV